MKVYLDLAISTTMMILVSPVLIGIALTGALVSGKPVVYGTPTHTPDDIYRVVSKAEKSITQLHA